MVSINVPKYKIRTTRWIGPRRIISGTIIHDNGVTGQIVLLKLRWDNKSGQQKWIIKLKKERCHWWLQTYFAGVGERGGGESAEDGGRYVVGRWWQDKLEGVGCGNGVGAGGDDNGWGSGWGRSTNGMIYGFIADQNTKIWYTRHKLRVN